jgi:hypothetical protein
MLGGLGWSAVIDITMSAEHLSICPGLAGGKSFKFA